jgi:hypothetical protein
LKAKVICTTGLAYLYKVDLGPIFFALVSTYGYVPSSKKGLRKLQQPEQPEQPEQPKQTEPEEEPLTPVPTGGILDELGGILDELGGK